MGEHLGLGVMIGMMGGNHETVDTHQDAVGKQIKDLSLHDDRLHIYFEDGTGIQIYDDGQSCCEDRWMHTDDELADFAGSTFLGAELRDGPTESGDCEEKESQFLLINTSAGTFTMVNYNEHNGYYGGFWMAVKPL